MGAECEVICNVSHMRSALAVSRPQFAGASEPYNLGYCSTTSAASRKDLLLPRAEASSRLVASFFSVSAISWDSPSSGTVKICFICCRRGWFGDEPLLSPLGEPTMGWTRFLFRTDELLSVVLGEQTMDSASSMLVGFSSAYLTCISLIILRKPCFTTSS